MSCRNYEERKAGYNDGRILDPLLKALHASSGATGNDMREAATVKAASMQRSKIPVDLTTVVDWRPDGTVEARLLPIDADLLAPDKTYLLAGLAKTMGRSLARWILMHGGRHIVLSSRHPEVPDRRWIQEMEELGGYVTVLPMDASDEKDVDAGPSKIPNMNSVLNFKVVGACLLHERFCDASTEKQLDFFVMFSSAASVGGNPGQSNYNVTNAYLQAFAQYRRTKGLTASTIHVGAVMGVGYLARSHLEEQLLKLHDWGKLSEGEFHRVFAEAIVSGQHVLGQDQGKAARQGSSTSRVSIKDRLHEAATLNEVKEAIIDGIAQKTRDILLIPADQSVNPSTALLDQGIDSLSAFAVSR
ncbi:KR-domain-containing protein [Colletotrichum caudatum]|nr:KR-domain-containing protein [Colletotrichum caudatum]